MYGGRCEMILAAGMRVRASVEGGWLGALLRGGTGYGNLQWGRGRLGTQGPSHTQEPVRAGTEESPLKSAVQGLLAPLLAKLPSVPPPSQL